MIKKFNKRVFAIVAISLLFLGLLVSGFSLVAVKSIHASDLGDYEVFNGEETIDSTQVVAVSIEDTNFVGTNTFLNVQNGQTVRIKGCTFSGSRDSAIVVEGGAVTLISSAISYSTAENGGAVKVNGGSLSLINSTITQAVASNQGGAIWINNGELKILTDHQVVNTVSALDDGCDEGESEWNSSITRCSAVNGGAIYAAGDSLVAINGALIERCNADAGGGIYLDDSHLIFMAGDVSNCVSPSGAGIYSDESRNPKDLTEYNNHGL